MTSFDEGVTQERHYPVVVVGGGPVGLAVAGDLGWRGNRCLLVERGTGNVNQPKMDLVGVRTMEFCRRWGLVPAVEAAPYPRDVPQDYIYLTSLRGFELSREPFPSKDQEPCPPQSPQKRERCPQHMFDPIMARFAASFPTVELRYETQLESLVETESHVELVLRNVRTGHEKTIRADYVVGADGGDSTVRKALSIGMSGSGTLTYTTNVLIRADLDPLHDKGRGYRYIFVGPEGTWLTITSTNGRDEWRVQFIGDAAPSKPSPEQVREALFRAVGCEFDYDIIDVMPWVRRELVAEHYGTRRCFLAGDSAHLMSPTGAFGMNTGMQDAVDIGWKLDAVLKGWGGPGLLLSYEQERRPVALRNVAEATGNLRRMLETRKRRPPPEVFQDGERAAAVRKEYGEWYADLLRQEWFTIGINLGYRYDDSCVICYDASPRPPLTVSTYEQTTLPGARAPHAWLAPGRSTLDAFGRGFTLVRSGPDAPPADPFAAAAARLGIPFSVLDIADPDICRLYERKLVLVRPDGHVGWRGHLVPAQPEAIFDTLRGASASQTRREPIAEGAT
ncbi:MAG: FAD-dependent monooxygenase [Pigmentiphaga sp.]|uniref:FAD-dependent monooxygenase n=1 Tax=Pigmentiphaga sp. TaxID=1977564 RepID=UPI0029A3AEDA|nr:FAD-dependent monooxygenase [Pigmentiphaga sp.]MDX3906326.1 FAD-dependent monooxygenase [Pigmentiphaga sp.]